MRARLDYLLDEATGQALANAGPVAGETPVETACRLAERILGAGDTR